MSEPFFVCENCQSQYLFESELVGKTIHCSVCGFAFRVPPVPFDQPAPVERGTGRWYLRFANGRQFGPVMRDSLREWVAEGRADGESLVLEEGTTLWMRLAEAFPELAGNEPPPQDPYAPLPIPVSQLKALGMLDPILDEFEQLSKAEQRNHEAAVQMVQRECQRAMGMVRVRGAKSVRIGDYVVFGESKRLPEEARPESLTVISLASQGAEFYLVIPWSRLGRLAHEFFSILPGRLPAPIALRRLNEQSFEGGQWVGISGTEEDVVAVAAKRTQEDLAKGIRWQWYSDDRSYTMVIVWGMQAVPLGADKFLHIVQTSCMGPAEQDFGLMWYLERQSAFFRFSRRLSVPGDHETHFLFSTSAGQLLSHLLG